MTVCRRCDIGVKGRRESSLRGDPGELIVPHSPSPTLFDHLREIGRELARALGAPKGVVLRAVLLEGAMMTLIGMIGGAAIAALFSGWLRTILYGVSRHDPATIAGVALLMCLVTGVATYIPARRAASVEPTAALREG